jgi:hypothetical protein
MANLDDTELINEIKQLVVASNDSYEFIQSVGNNGNYLQNYFNTIQPPITLDKVLASIIWTGLKSLFETFCNNLNTVNKVNRIKTALNTISNGNPKYLNKNLRRGIKINENMLYTNHIPHRIKTHITQPLYYLRGLGRGIGTLYEVIVSLNAKIINIENEREEAILKIQKITRSRQQYLKLKKESIISFINSLIEQVKNASTKTQKRIIVLRALTTFENPSITKQIEEEVEKTLAAEDIQRIYRAYKKRKQQIATGDEGVAATDIGIMSGDGSFSMDLDDESEDDESEDEEESDIEDGYKKNLTKDDIDKILKYANKILKTCSLVPTPLLTKFGKHRRCSKRKIKRKRSKRKSRRRSKRKSKRRRSKRKNRKQRSKSKKSRNKRKSKKKI